MKTQTTAEGQTVINILDHDAQTMYMYMPEQNTAFKMSYDPSQTSPMEETQDMDQYNPQTIGTEVVDGKECLVVEYTVEDSSITSWIWKEYGFPIKVVSATSEGTITIEYRNIEFTDIPDSEFELPDGVQIMDFPTQP